MVDAPGMPEMSAEQLKENLFALLVLGNDTASRILADLPPLHLRRIERADRAEWLPIEIELTLTRAVLAEVGEEGLGRWSSAALKRSLDSSLFRPLLDSAVRLFGLSPQGLFKMAPQGWRRAFRGAGELAVQPNGPGALQVDLVGLPEELKDRSFVLTIGTCLYALFDACQVAGRVQVVAPPPGVGARYQVSWTAR
jgi:hypothetical protein